MRLPSIGPTYLVLPLSPVSERFQSVDAAPFARTNGLTAFWFPMRAADRRPRRHKEIVQTEFGAFEALTDKSAEWKKWPRAKSVSRSMASGRDKTD